VVAPLGIDFDYWNDLSKQQSNTVWHKSLLKTPFILSVDRADYTKGVIDRIQTIDQFFTNYPRWQEKIVFAQICGRTRSGLAHFDSYFERCQLMSEQLNERWATNGWQPLVTINSSFESPQLALAYATAAGMLVSPVRDGLNLTAKEYVACQGNNPGFLALSTEAGAWHELKSHCLSLQPGDCQQMASVIHEGLTMDPHEKSWRMALLKDSVRANTLRDWCNTFSRLLGDKKATADTRSIRGAAAATARLQRLRETS
jgi:trehalose 6-phosphate synthase